MPTVLITGANRGLGFEFTRQYAGDGWDVVACCRAPDKADRLQALAKANKKIRVEALEVTDGNAIASLAQRLGDTAIDVLINNAGVPSSGAASVPGDDNYYTVEEEFERLDAEEWLGALRVNTISPVMITRGAKVIMMSSRYGSLALNFPDLMTYAASQVGLNIVMRKLALLLKAKGMIVISMSPGRVKTDMGGPDAPLAPEISIAGMRKVIAGLTPEKTGQFFAYDGTVMPW
jgi:NAD(P)-dependent dehydrogenase (short-subunit alcohol dehydrogenase family)